MARAQSWRELTIGITGFAVLAGVALWVLLFARVGALHGDTDSIFVLTDDAPGVLNGTEVWLAGRKIGQVRDIHFRPVSTDTLRRLAIHTDILSDQLHYIRRDAYADIRPGGNLIGSPVVWISAGTLSAAPLKNGDSLVTKSTGAMKPVGDKIEALGTRVTLLADSGAKVVGMLNSQIGTLGRLLNNGLPRVARAAGQIASLKRKATAGNGSIALAMNGDVRARFGRIMSTKDSIRALLSSGNGNVARVRNDSTLMRTTSHLRGELDSLMAFTSSSGTIAKARSDTALTAEMTKARAELSAIIADLKKHPGKYVHF